MVASGAPTARSSSRRRARCSTRELDKVGIPAEISGRAKHFYSIYEKMAKRGKEFNEIYDLTAMRVIVETEGKEGERDCYGALGIIHSLWKPMPGRFKDYVAMPKFNLYRSLHTTVIGPEGKPLEIQVRTREMHRDGRVRHRRALALQGQAGEEGSEAERLAWLKQLADWQQEETDPASCGAPSRSRLRRGLRLHAEGRAEEPPRRLDADRLRLRRPHGRRPPHGRREGERAHRPAPLPAAHRRLRRDPDLALGGRGPVARLALARRLLARAQQDPPVVSRETREETEQRGRETLEAALKQHKLPYKKLAGSPLLAEVIREMGFKKAEDFYLALGVGQAPVRRRSRTRSSSA